MITNLLFISLTYGAFILGKDLPFHYITQSDYSICKYMNGNFCVFIAYFIVALAIYNTALPLYNYFIVEKAKPKTPAVSNALADPITNNLSKGALYGGGIALLSFVCNILFGFVKIKKIDFYNKITGLFPTFIGMSMNSITEELIYRGVLIGFARPFINNNLCVLLSSAIFAYVHAAYSLQYAISAFISGLIFGFGYLRYGLYFSIGFHALFNFIETSLYTISKFSVINKFMAGERKTPDDDGITTIILNGILLIVLFLTKIF